MNYKRFINGTFLSVTAMSVALAFSPLVGVQSAVAAPQEVQQSDVITGTVVDESGETIIGATVVVVGGNDDPGIGHIVGVHQIFAEDLMIVLFEEHIGTFDGGLGQTLAEQLHCITMMDDEVVGPCGNADAEAKNRGYQMLHLNINTFECV